MPINLTPFGATDSLWTGNTWAVPDDDILARWIAWVAIGQALHVAEILHSVNPTGTPPTNEAAKADAVELLTQKGADAMNVRGRYQLTSQTPGATVVERVDLVEFIQFARVFDPAGANPLGQVVEFAASLMTGVGAAALLERVRVLQYGRPRNPPTQIEAAALAFAQGPSMGEASRLLQAFARQPGTHVYRPEVLRCCLAAMQVAARGTCTLHAAALQARERQRHMSRPVSRRSVGSTLLLKGLEADVAVVLEPQVMTAAHLYVALTRGARRVVVCSPTSILTPRVGA